MNRYANAASIFLLLDRIPPSGRVLVCSPMLCLSAVLWCGTLHAGKYNSVLDVGDQVPAWNDLPGVDGEKHSLEQLAEAKAVVVVFTCNSCPYAVDVEQRLMDFQRDYADRGVRLVAINVNKVEEDRLPAMKEAAKEKGFEFPYLFDESQQIARDYGARNTPQFFVLDGERKIVYMGALDDSPNGKDIKKRYVREAVDAILDGSQPEVSETVSIGCLIRYDRERRRRRSDS